MMIPVIDAVNDKCKSIIHMNPSAVDELLGNNCTMPNIKRVIFNLKTMDSKAERDADGNLVIDENTRKPKRIQTACKPVLATSIEFIDNTKCTVQNSLNDVVQIEYEELEDGTKVIVATEQAKELGVVYCILKRIVGKPDERGTIIGDGFGRILRDIVRDGYDENLEAAKNRVAKVKSKKLHDEKMKNAKKTKNPSLLETAIDFSKTAKELADVVATLKADMAELKAKVG